MTFYPRIANTSIAAIADRYLSDGDYVAKTAWQEVSAEDVVEIRFLIGCLAWSLEHSSVELPYHFFEEDQYMNDFAARYGHQKLADLIDRYNNHAIDFSASGTTVLIDRYPAIQALYYDFKVRYDEDPSDLRDHLTEFLIAGHEEDGDGDKTDDDFEAAAS